MVGRKMGKAVMGGGGEWKRVGVWEHRVLTSVPEPASVGPKAGWQGSTELGWTAPEERERKLLSSLEPLLARSLCSYCPVLGPAVVGPVLLSGCHCTLSLLSPSLPCPSPAVQVGTSSCSPDPTHPMLTHLG